MALGLKSASSTLKSRAVASYKSSELMVNLHAAVGGMASVACVQVAATQRKGPDLLGSRHVPQLHHGRVVRDDGGGRAARHGVRLVVEHQA